MYAPLQKSAIIKDEVKCAGCIYAQTGGTNMNKVHLIGNAHLDPAWLWRWQEGCNEVMQTFRSALDRLNEYDDFDE